MNVLIFFICMFSILIFLFVDKRIYNPLIIFNLWWGITVFLSGFGINDIFIPKNETYFIVLIGVISFNTSFIIYFLFKYKSNNNNFNNLQNSHFERVNKLLFFSHLIIIFELLRRSFVVISLLRSGMPYGRIRYAYFYEDQIMPGYSMLFDNLFVSPITTFSIILIALNINNKKFNRKLIFSTFIIIALTVFSSGARGILVETILAFILSLIFFRRGIKLKLTNKLKLLVITTIIAFSAIYVTGMRTSEENYILKSIEHIISYYTAPYIYFEVLTEYAIHDREPLYGFTIFGGFWDLFILLFRVLGLEVKTISSYISEYNQTYLLIGDDLIFNALPSMLYTFVYDLGILGAILGPFIFGLLSMYIYLKMLSSGKLKYKGMYIMICFMIYGSVMKWEGIYTSTWLVFILFIVYDYLSNRKIVIRNSY